MIFLNKMFLLLSGAPVSCSVPWFTRYSVNVYFMPGNWLAAWSRAHSLCLQRVQPPDMKELRMSLTKEVWEIIIGKHMVCVCVCVCLWKDNFPVPSTLVFWDEISLCLELARLEQLASHLELSLRLSPSCVTIQLKIELKSSQMTDTLLSLWPSVSSSFLTIT